MSRVCVILLKSYNLHPIYFFISSSFSVLPAKGLHNIALFISYSFPFRHRNYKMGIKIPPAVMTGGISFIYMLTQRIIGGCAPSRISFDPQGTQQHILYFNNSLSKALIPQKYAGFKCRLSIPVTAGLPLQNQSVSRSHNSNHKSA